MSVLLLSASPAFGQQLLPPFDPLDDTIDLVRGDRETRYRIEVDADAVGLRVQLSGARADLDLVLYDGRGEEIARAEQTAFNEELVWMRDPDRLRAEGVLELAVVYQLPGLPQVDDRRRSRLSYTIEYAPAVPPMNDPLIAGEAVYGELEPVNMMTSYFPVYVPPGVNHLRIDIFDASGDIDLFVNRERPAPDLFASDYYNQTLRSRESIVISSRSDPPLRSGRYVVAVVDQIAFDEPARFGIMASFSDTAPRSISGIPTLNRETADLDRAVLSTVEVISTSGSGSGVVVSSRGHILTNYHVIEDPSGRASDQLWVAVSLDIRRPPQEYFMATVLKTLPDADLALIQVSGDLGGRPLPAWYRFPYLGLGRVDELGLGDTLRVIGYPGVGGTGSRASLTYTRGIVSGFQTHLRGTVIKTDALINQGNSGGAGLNQNYELVGLPTLVVGSDGGSIGYLFGVDMLPEDWRRIVREGNDIWF